MGSEIYPKVHENPRAFFSSSSPIFLEPLAHGSSDWSLPREDCISFACSKCLILSKGNEERYSKTTSLPNALSKETLGQTLANLLRVHPWTSIVISFSSRENSSSFFVYKEID